MLDVCVMVKTPIGLPARSVSTFASKFPEEEKGSVDVPFIDPCVEKAHLPTRAKRGLLPSGHCALAGDTTRPIAKKQSEVILMKCFILISCCK